MQRNLIKRLLKYQHMVYNGNQLLFYDGLDMEPKEIK